MSKVRLHQTSTQVSINYLSSDIIVIIESDSDDSTSSNDQSILDDGLHMKEFNTPSGTVWSSQQPHIRLLERNIINFRIGTTGGHRCNYYFLKISYV